MKNKLYIIFYKLLYKIFCLFSVNNNQCVFCSMDKHNVFGNLSILKEYLKHEYQCFSCVGKIDTISKAIRTARKIAGTKFIFLDAAYTYTSIIKIRKESQVIQLWHAAGAFKKMGLHSIRSKSESEFRKQNALHGYYNYVIVSSKSVIDTYADAFQIEKNRILPLGLPRIQKLIEQNTDREKYKNWLCYKFENLWYKKIILYAPTFREAKGKRNYYPGLNIINFASQLPDDYALAVKLHPRCPKTVQEKLPKNITNLTNIEYNICLICSDILITDYSSIVFDFTCLQKPVLFYTPDEITYERGLYFIPREKYPNITFNDYYKMADFIMNNDNLSKMNIYSKKIYEEYMQGNNTLHDIKNLIYKLSLPNTGE